MLEYEVCAEDCEVKGVWTSELHRGDDSTLRDESAQRRSRTSGRTHPFDVVGGTVALPRMVSLTKRETAIRRVMTRGMFRDGDRSVRIEMGTRR